MTIKRLAIIGGGAAGFFCAANLSDITIKDKLHITIFEQLPTPMLKLLATGGGRCNITNDIDNISLLVKQYPRGEKFLYTVFKQFSPKDMIEWLKHNKVLTYTNDENCVFLKSESAETLSRLFLRKTDMPGISFVASAAIDSVFYENDKFTVTYSEKDEQFDFLLLACGGSRNVKRHIQTVNGYKLAKSLGHTVSSTKEVLGGIIIDDKNISNAAGITFDNASIVAKINNKKVAQTYGSVLFTHKGVSGPAILNMSSLLADYDFNVDKINLFIKVTDFKDSNTADITLQDQFAKHNNKDISNIVSSYYPKSLAGYVLLKNNIDPQKKANSITKLERKLLSEDIFQLALPVKAIDTNSCIVTAGGVDLNEIDAKTMLSKKNNNLFFAGEILNVDGFCGGYNLQFAWSSAYIAARSILNLI